jgi:hypothetical protein
MPVDSHPDAWLALFGLIHSLLASLDISLMQIRARAFLPSLKKLLVIAVTLIGVGGEVKEGRHRRGGSDREFPAGN